MTEAGRDLLAGVFRVMGVTIPPKHILAIEQEAAAAERARIRDAVDRMDFYDLEDRDAVLALLDPLDPRSDKEPTP